MIKLKNPLNIITTKERFRKKRQQLKSLFFVITSNISNYFINDILDLSLLFSPISIHWSLAYMRVADLNIFYANALFCNA